MAKNDTDWITDAIHADLVSPVCALEELTRMNDVKDYGAILDCISMAFRQILDKIERGGYQ